MIQKLENALADLTRSVGRDPKATAGVGSSRDQFEMVLPHWKEILTELRTMTSRVEDLTRGLNTRRKDDGCPSLDTATPDSAGFVPSVTISFPHLSANSSFINDTASLHLSTQQATICWQVFLDRVDPLVKILHRPTVERLLGRSLYEKDLLRDCEVVLLFTIFFSSIISISAHEVETFFSISKPTIVSTYHSAIHEALSRNGFLATEDLTTLQALVLFLDQSRMAGSPKQAWALTGLARRLSLVMTAEQPTRFEAEMHRRLWWQLWYLDHRATKDHGRECFPGDATPLPDQPMNINDEDLDPHSADLPPNGRGFKDTTFSLVRFEIARTSCLIARDMPLEPKGRAIRDCERQIRSNYFVDCDDTKPIVWLTRHVAYVHIMEMWFSLYTQLALPPHISPRLQKTLDRLLIGAIDILDVPRRLRREPHAAKWDWLLTLYLQFLPLQFLLTELCRRQNDQLSERAWRIANMACDRWRKNPRGVQNEMVLSQLLEKATFKKSGTSWIHLMGAPFSVQDIPAIMITGGGPYSTERTVRVDQTGDQPPAESLDSENVYLNSSLADISNLAASGMAVDRAMGVMANSQLPEAQLSVSQMSELHAQNYIWLGVENVDSLDDLAWPT